jgi:hypothetical protein
MPKGFIGNAPALYLNDVTTAHQEAINAGNQIVSGAPSSNPPGYNGRRPPFESRGTNGSVVTGQGSSSNIVVDTHEYAEINMRISQADDKMGECLYRVALEVEEMCRTTYILPETIPHCLNVADAIKASLGEFRSLTEEALTVANSFARDIADIGR